MRGLQVNLAKHKLRAGAWFIQKMVAGTDAGLSSTIKCGARVVRNAVPALLSD